MIPLILIGVIVSGVLILWWLLKDDSVLKSKPDFKCFNNINEDYDASSCECRDEFKEYFIENYTWACDKFGVGENIFLSNKNRETSSMWYICHQIDSHSTYLPNGFPKPKSYISDSHLMLSARNYFPETKWMKEFIEIVQKIKQNVSDEELDLILKYHKHNLKRKEFRFVFDKCEKHKYNQEQLFGKEFGNI